MLRLTLSNLDASSIGEFIVLWQTVTVLMGYLYGVDPYTQPGVDETKRQIRFLMEQK